MNIDKCPSHHGSTRGAFTFMEQSAESLSEGSAESAIALAKQTGRPSRESQPVRRPIFAYFPNSFV